MPEQPALRYVDRALAHFFPEHDARAGAPTAANSSAA